MPQIQTSSLLSEFYLCYEPDREALTKSEKYLRNCFESKSRILVVNSNAVSVGQFWAGRKTEMKNLYASSPRTFPIVFRRPAISWRTSSDELIYGIDRKSGSTYHEDLSVLDI